MHRIVFQPSGRQVEVPPGTPLIEAVRSVGLPIARGCGLQGLCSHCALRVLEGAETLAPESSEEMSAKRRNRVASELRLACCTVVAGDQAVTASYW